MKNIQQNIIKKISLLSLFMMILFSSLNAQDSSKVDKITDEIANRNFVFVAQSVNPMRGSLRQLTTYYSLKISKDSLISDLPYFGRVYTAPLNAREGGIHFTSTDFIFNQTQRKKGGWDIIIKPKSTDVQQLYLTVFNNGYATLQVTSNNRESISYNGYIASKK